MNYDTELTSSEIRTLRESHIIQGLTDEDLTPIVTECELLKVSPGADMVTEGEPGKGIFFLLEGEVQIYLPIAEGRPSEVNLAKFGSGMVFGEYSILDDRPASASVKALTKAKLVFLSGKNFRNITETHDRIGRVVYQKLLIELVDRLRNTDKDLDIAFVY